MLVCSLPLPLAGTNPHSKSKWKLTLPPLGSKLDHFYQSAVDRWEKEAVSYQLSPFPSGLSPNFSCHLPGASTLSHMGKFVSAPFPKSVTLSGLKAPSSDFIKPDFSVHHKVANTASVQYLLLLLLDSVEAFKKGPSHDPKEVWVSFCQLFTDTVLALQPLFLDTLGSAVCAQAKVRMEMLKDVQPQVQQELLLAPLFSAQPVEPTQAAMAVKTAASQQVRVTAVIPKSSAP